MSDQAKRLRTSREEIAAQLGDRLKINWWAELLNVGDGPYKRMWDALIESEVERDALQHEIEDFKFRQRAWQEATLRLFAERDALQKRVEELERGLQGARIALNKIGFTEQGLESTKTARWAIIELDKLARAALKGEKR